MSLFEIIGAVLIGPLKTLFEIIFSQAYDILNNPGLAVIVLSLAMNILVLPLYRRADAIQIDTLIVAAVVAVPLLLLLLIVVFIDDAVRRRKRRK